MKRGGLLGHHSADARAHTRGALMIAINVVCNICLAVVRGGERVSIFLIAFDVVGLRGPQNA